MEGAIEITRKAIHTFLQNYHSLATVAAILALPASASTLFSTTFTSHLETVENRINSLFKSANIPASADFFVALNNKLSHTFFSYVFTLPFALTFLIIAKAIVIKVVFQRPKAPESQPSLVLSSFHTYTSILHTYIVTSLATLYANASIISILFLVFNVLDILNLVSPNTTLLLSTCGAVLYSVILAHVSVACNLAIVLSGVENRGGLVSLAKAFLLVRGQAGTGLLLAVVANLCIGLVEGLFNYRVVRLCGGFCWSFVWEGLVVCYIHAVVVVLDVVGTCLLYKRCGGCVEGVGERSKCGEVV